MAAGSISLNYSLFLLLFFFLFCMRSHARKVETTYCSCYLPYLPQETFKLSFITKLRNKDYASYLLYFCTSHTLSALLSFVFSHIPPSQALSNILSFVWLEELWGAPSRTAPQYIHPTSPFIQLVPLFWPHPLPYTPIPSSLHALIPCHSPFIPSSPTSSLHPSSQTLRPSSLYHCCNTSLRLTYCSYSPSVINKSLIHLMEKKTSAITSFRSRRAFYFI